jgi:hypothetical protein
MPYLALPLGGNRNSGRVLCCGNLLSVNEKSSARHLLQRCLFELLREAFIIVLCFVDCGKLENPGGETPFCCCGGGGGSAWQLF